MKLVIVTLHLLLLVSTNVAQSDALVTSVSEVVETDFGICGDNLPEPPHCVWTSLHDGGFPNASRYRACAKSVKNYIAATEEHKTCKRRQAQQHQDTMAIELRAVAQCLKDRYEEAQNQYETTTPINPCGDGFKNNDPIVSYHELMIHYDIPDCLRPYFRTKRLVPNKFCVEEVEGFLKERADQEMQEGIRQVEFLVDTFKRKVVEAFDCIVKGGSRCYKS